VEKGAEKWYKEGQRVAIVEEKRCCGKLSIWRQKPGNQKKNEWEREGEGGAENTFYCLNAAKKPFESTN